MNLPNQLTVLRMLLIIPFVLLLQGEPSASQVLAALVIFIAASLTDMLDGQIARKYNLITNFGKLMDPLADKLLMMAAMLCLVELREIPAFVVVIILSREFLVTSVRLVAAGEGVVIAADKLGKLKTVLQMLWVIATLLWMYLRSGVAAPSAQAVTEISLRFLMYAALLLTILSGANYILKNKRLIFSDK